jgi:mono/diheme cytochrome c family protein
MPRTRQTLFCICAAAFAFSCRSLSTESAPQNPAVEKAEQRDDVADHGAELLAQGREVFRYDTFGSEAFWGGQLRLHETLAGEKHGGSGPGLSARQALAAGLKVDVAQLPKILYQAVAGGSVDLDATDTALELIKANAVVGITGFFEDPNDRLKLTGIGIQCALCHSTVDDSLVKGIGRRLDGWPNRDLDVGAIISLAPSLAPNEKALQKDAATIRKVLRSWGPGRYDAELNQDGRAFRPDGKTGATVLPAAFGLAGVNLHTYTGWGSVTHWNAYVAVTQMHGQGTFFDPRLADAKRFPVAARTGAANVRNVPDRVTPKLAALHYYQLSIPAPRPDDDTFDAAAAERGRAVFEGKAKCATCHVPPLFTEPGWNMHTARELGIDDFQASRSPDAKYYRTTPLGGLFVRAKGGFYHDGRFADLDAVVSHYDRQFKLGLDAKEVADLIQYLKSL